MKIFLPIYFFDIWGPSKTFWDKTKGDAKFLKENIPDLPFDDWEDYRWPFDACAED